jgi:hypothetical protein
MWQALDAERHILLENKSLAVVIWMAMDRHGNAQFLSFTGTRPLDYLEQKLLDLFECSVYPVAPSDQHPGGTLEVAL